MKHAFSLVELSIVLVILGLLTGGILTGQNLIRAAELRSVSTQHAAYQTAVMTFRDKYFAVPGDMRNATDFWGSAGGNGADAACQAIVSAGTETCNGNSDGWSQTSITNFDERFRFWQQLANAGLIEGSFTGRDNAATQGNTADANYFQPGTNVPLSKLNGYWHTGAQETQTNGNPNWFDGLGPQQFMWLTSQGGNLLTPEEQWNLDTKIDDGRPGYGTVFSVQSTSTWAAGCSTTDDEATAEYALSNTNKICTPWMKVF